MKFELKKKERAIFVLTFLLAIFTRFFMLDERPMDHDESIHAYLSYILMKKGEYHYDPAFHGPFLYYSTALIFYLVGDSEFSARLVPVLFSLLGVFFAYKFKKWLSCGAYLLMFFMIFSTSILYYSRYMRNDIILLSSFLAILYFYFEYLEKRGLLSLIAISFFFGIILTSKENGYIYLFIFISYIILSKILKKAFKLNKPENSKSLKNNVTDPIRLVKIVIASVIPFLLIFTMLYTHLFSNLQGLEDATVGAISHWIKMHEKKDHWKPIYYYFSLLIQYEFLPVGLTAFSIPTFIKRLKRRKITEIELFSFHWLVLSFIIYHYISHKVPWLLLHLVLPLCFFSSLYLEKITQNFKKGLKVAILLGILFTTSVSLSLTFVNYNNTAEDLIYIQAQPSVVDLSKKIIELKKKGECIVIYEPTYDYWPLPWYLRHEKISFISYGIPQCKFIVTSEKFAENVKDRGYKALKAFLVRPGHYLILMQKLED